MDQAQGILMEPVKIEKKCRAIVAFGPVTPMTGTRGGAFFQVTIDPSLVSPGGQFIRFGLHSGDEIQGWQQIDTLTLCEILGEFDADGNYPEADGKTEPLQMMKIS